MSPAKRQQKETENGDVYHIINSQFKGSAIGTKSVVNNFQGNSRLLEQFSAKLKELESEVSSLSDKLSREDYDKVMKKIGVIESQIQKPDKSTSETVISTLKEISGIFGSILGGASVVGTLLKNLMDFASQLGS